MWPTIWPFDAGQTARRAEREDSGKVLADVVFLSASVISIQDKEIRAMILRHMWLSYLFGAVIVAITINLIAGLTTK